MTVPAVAQTCGNIKGTLTLNVSLCLGNKTPLQELKLWPIPDSLEVTLAVTH